MTERRHVHEVTVTATDAKNRFGEMLSRVTKAGEAVIVERQGRPNAALISIEEYRELRELQERRRRQEALLQLEAARRRIAASLGHLTDDEIDQIANEIRHDVHQALIEKGHVRFVE